MTDDVTANAFKEVAQALAQEVSIRNAKLEKTKPVEIKV
jgi:ATP-binding protein involved in chromosome partitioning